MNEGLARLKGRGDLIQLAAPGRIAQAAKEEMHHGQ